MKRRRWEKRMDAELRFHLDTQIRDYVSQGMSPSEAEQRARREFGAVELAKDECRDRMPLAWLDYLSRDLRLAMRSLHKSPGFAAAAIVTLALGIGANTAIFSAVYAVLLKPLPYFEPDQLYMVQIEIPERLQQFGRLTGRIQDYLEWRKADTVFSGVAALTPAEWNLTGNAEPEHVGGASVSTNFFSFLGVPIAHGRGFVRDEEQPGNDNVVVISDGLWRRRYASDPAMIGKTIELNGGRHVVVGIAPPGLQVPTGKLLYLPFASQIDVWRPQAPTNADLQGENWNQGLLLRLKPSANLETGRQQLQALLNAPAKHLPAGLKLIPCLIPIRDVFAGKVRLRLLLLLGASALLLLIACTNIVNLFLARVASRSTEFATRIALGAGQARIVIQMLTESMLLSLLGGVLGAAVAYGGVQLLIGYAPGDVGLLGRTHLNLPVLLFALLTSLITGFCCGAVPAWQAYRTDTGATLKEGARAALGGSHAARFRQVLVGIEMALGTTLLASAALLLHSFVNIMGADRGYQVERVLVVDLALSGERYSSDPQRLAFYRKLTENLRTLPGVLAAGAISEMPVSGEAGSQVIFLDTDTDAPRLVLKRPVAGFRQVTPGYFAASQSSLLAGRFFAVQDRVTTAIVSESLAKRLWPGEPPSKAVGRRIRQGDVVDAQAPLLTVIGIVRDVRAGAIDRELLPQIYRPYLTPNVDGRMTVVVRTAWNPANLAAAVRAEVRKLEPNLPIPPVRTMREIVSSTVAERRFQMALTALFALVALLLATVGIYSVVSYAVACRTRDIGLRIALGALQRDILGLILLNGMRAVFIGVVIGLAGAAAIASALRSLLFGIAPTDTLSLASVTLTLLLTAAFACYLPARRASQLDPMTALRHE